MLKFCSLFSGSSGNCIFVTNDRVKILVDCGVSGKRIAASLAEIEVNPCEVDAIFITHEHNDHITGAGIMSRRYSIPIYANRLTWDAMYGSLGKINEDYIKCFEENSSVNIGNMTVQPFPIPHDAACPVGYNFLSDGKKISIATDIGHLNEDLFDYLKDADMVLIEANHDVEMLKAGSYPYPLKRRIIGERGHLSNMQAGSLVSRLAMNGTMRFLLGHLSRENNFPELAYQTVLNELIHCKINNGICLDVAPRDRNSELIVI